MARIVLDLPDEIVARLRAEAARRQTTAEILLARHVAANPPHQAAFTPPPDYYASLWGAAADGSGAHGSVEAVDRYVRDLRDEWDER